MLGIARNGRNMWKKHELIFNFFKGTFWEIRLFAFNVKLDEKIDTTLMYVRQMRSYDNILLA